MNAVARFIVSRILARSGGGDGCPDAATPTAMATNSERTASPSLRARLNIWHLCKEPALVAPRIVHDLRRAIEHHRGATREIVDWPPLEVFRLRVARPRKRDPRIAHARGELESVRAGPNLVGHDRRVIEHERDVEAMMRAPSAAIDRRPPVALAHPRAIRAHPLR